MDILKDIAELINNGSNEFRVYEKVIIEAVISALNPEAQAILSRQVSSINFVTRMIDDKEVYVYDKKRKNDIPLFPNVNEAQLAAVSLYHPNLNETINAKVWMIKGHIVEINLDKSPRIFFKGYPFRSVRPDVARLKILCDPMIFIPSEKEEAKPESLQGWVKDWYSQGMITGLIKPLGLAEYLDCLSQIEGLLPDDYLEFIKQTEGAHLKNGEILGLSHIRYIADPNANLYMLGEIKNGAFVVIAGTDNKIVHFIDYETHEIRELGTSFKQSVEMMSESYCPFV